MEDPYGFSAFKKFNNMRFLAIFIDAYILYSRIS